MNNRRLNHASRREIAPHCHWYELFWPTTNGPTNTALVIYKIHSIALLGSVKYNQRWKTFSVDTFIKIKCDIHQVNQVTLAATLTSERMSGIIILTTSMKLPKTDSHCYVNKSWDFQTKLTIFLFVIIALTWGARFSKKPKLILRRSQSSHHFVITTS